MSGSDFDPSILVFAALAAFVVWKLWSVLGVRVDREGPASDRAGPARRIGPAPAPQGSAFAPSPANGALDADRWKGLAESGSNGWRGLDQIAASDRSFSGPAFVEGAKKAYEMIVQAFARGDRDTLRNLLSTEVFDSFSGEIAGREQRGETAEAHVVSIDSATVEDAKVELRKAQITIRFVAKLQSVRRDSAGAAIEGESDRPLEIVDLWTFARDVASRDPNWKLVATETVH
ncbi:Tim44/TimA family putative adaptor protein [Methylosinus sp. LW3]|uniref:Tim44/TimA family putative adaptor protein n=1 Tax=Methylosinus sp. LW3 TaxID=107635 RepID=UPI0004663C4A|nr:Tim44/TimA family putative adaptor protein [Methylosinus sp. LW3]